MKYFLRRYQQVDSSSVSGRHTSWCMHILACCVFLYFVSGALVHVKAQVFPIQVTTQLTPPFTPYLTDYTAPGSERLMVQLRANDLSIADYLCKFRLTIEGVGITIRTKQNFVPRPTTFYGGGSPQILYGDELLEYFNPANLDFSGLSRAEFTKTGKLPAGVYRFTLEVLDYNRGAVVSNKGTTLAWIILNDPPLLNLPRKDSRIVIPDPANIVFTWTPRHTGSPNAAFSTAYTFRLVEIWPLTRNPYDAFLSQPPLHEVTTTQTQILYGPAEPALLPGRKYAWQVQAHDVDGRDLFKNDGRSEVFVFQYGDALGVPENVRNETTNPLSLGVRWESAQQGEVPRQYRIRYRAPGSNEAWYEQVTQQRWATLTSLQGGSDYEVQVRAEASPQVSDYSPVQIMRTAEPGSNQFMCGRESTAPSSTHTQPLLALSPGDVLTCRNFKVVVTEANGAAGSFNGSGIMQVPMFSGASVRVVFAGTLINSNYELVTGEINTVYHAGSSIAQVIDEIHTIGETQSHTPQPPPDTTTTPDAYAVPGIIDSIYVADDGTIVVTDTEGNETVLVPKDNPNTGSTKATRVTDAEGTVYEVKKDPATGETTVTKITGSRLPPGSSTASATVQADPVKDRIIVLLLEQVREEIAAWLRMNGKGGEEDHQVLRMEELPECLPRDVNILNHIHDHTIPYFSEHPAELRATLESNPASKELLDSVALSFSQADAVVWEKINQDEREALQDATCPAIVAGDQVVFEAELKSALGGDSAKDGCVAQGWERGVQLYKRFDAGIAIYAGFLRYLTCTTENENCGSSNLSDYTCGLTNGLLTELDWFVLLEGEGITKEDIVSLIRCVKDAYPMGGKPEDNPRLYEILFRCIVGSDLKDLGDAMVDFVAENWDEPYYQGQATAFVATLLSPFKARILEKLKTLSKYGNKITKLEKLAESKSVSEFKELVKKLGKGGSKLLDDVALRSLNPEVPNGTFINSTKFNNSALKIDPPANSQLKQLADDVKSNGDVDIPGGSKTEQIQDILYADAGYTKLDGKVGSNQGLDGLYIKGDVKNPSEIIVAEAKQWQSSGGIKLNDANLNTGLPIQMSDAWIQNVALRLQQAGKNAVADMLLNPAFRNKISKYAIVVDKTTGQINILKLGTY